MISTLAQAKAFLLDKITEYVGEPLDPIEKDVLETLLEDNFFEKIQDLVDEQEIESRKLDSEEAFESYLFHKIPNYTTLLEETAAETIADYLADDEDEETPSA